ncbi:MAG: hypothetical protein AAF409_10820 [Pseudomonadota bacterium]
MTRTIATALVALSMISTPAAFAGENVAREAQTKIDIALGKTKPAPTGGQVSLSRDGSERGAFFGLVTFEGTQWEGNYRGGRVHPPAGR